MRTRPSPWCRWRRAIVGVAPALGACALTGPDTVRASPGADRAYAERSAAHAADVAAWGYLPPCDTVVGRVRVFGAGRPAPGAIVGLRLGDATVVAQADADGAFAVAVPSSRRPIRAAAALGGRATPDFGRAVDLGPDAGHVVTFFVSPGGDWVTMWYNGACRATERGVALDEYAGPRQRGR